MKGLQKRRCNLKNNTAAAHHTDFCGDCGADLQHFAHIIEKDALASALQLSMQPVQQHWCFLQHA